MADDTKIWLALVALAALFLTLGAALMLADMRDKATLQQAACAAPESVACALAVRR